MKKFITLCVAAVVLVAVVCGVLAGCDPNGFASGFGTDNNGYAKNDEEVQRLISVVPNERQLEFLEMEYYNFIHFGMNTFTRKQWGTGEEDPATFNPTALDTDQWCEIIKNSGSTGVIITAKHHDGFCLWQTSTTEHSVKNSPWMNGQGDVVKMLSESCEKYGLKMGIYLSPWDMNAESYGDTEAYNKFYMDQLRELLVANTDPTLTATAMARYSACGWTARAARMRTYPPISNIKWTNGKTLSGRCSPTAFPRIWAATCAG